MYGLRINNTYERVLCMYSVLLYTISCQFILLFYKWAAVLFFRISCEHKTQLNTATTLFVQTLWLNNSHQPYSYIFAFDFNVQEYETYFVEIKW